jgi:hypothetical protein
MITKTKEKTHKQAIYERTLDMYADLASIQIKKQVKELLETREYNLRGNLKDDKSSFILIRRATMLLQAAGKFYRYTLNRYEMI